MTKMPDGSTSVVERIPAVEMAWRDAARHLCEKARLDFETWDFQLLFRGVESYADAPDEDVPRIAEATPTGVGLAEGMLLRTLYRDLEAIQQGTCIQAVVKSVERRGAPLLAVLKDIAKGLAVWRDGHIGVYIGGGYVIEAMGTKYGVVKTKLSERSFTNWLEIPYIDYD